MLQGGKFDKKGRWSGNTALASGDETSGLW